MSDLRNCCSDEDLSTAPWSFLHYLSFLSVFVKQCEKITKEGVDRVVALSIYCITKQPLAHNPLIINTINRRGVFACTINIRILTNI